jgi:hypothetical protein
MKRVAGRSACGAVVATVSAAQARAAAEAAATQASAPLPFRRDTDDTGFPVAGAVLLLVLAGATVLTWWRRHRQGGGTFPPLGAPAGAPRVTASARLDAHTRLHVVEWHGRQLLLAVNGAAAPVVLDRIGPTPEKGGA